MDGVVDSEDLPLNVCRETVQTRRVMERIKGALTRQSPGCPLKDLAATDAEKYRAFWREYAQFVKEGMATEPTARDDLTPLLRFHSSRTAADELVSLPVHWADAGDSAPSTSSSATTSRRPPRSPHLDYFRKEKLEVLFLVDPLDGFMPQGLQEYQGFPLKNVDYASLDLPGARRSRTPRRGRCRRPNSTPCWPASKSALGERVTDVRASDILVDNPAAPGLARGCHRLATWIACAA